MHFDHFLFSFLCSSHIAAAIYNTTVLGAIFVVLTKAVLTNQRDVKIFECVGVFLCATVTLGALFGPKVKSVYFPNKFDLLDVCCFLLSSSSLLPAPVSQCCVVLCLCLCCVVVCVMKANMVLEPNKQAPTSSPQNGVIRRAAFVQKAGVPASNVNISPGFRPAAGRVSGVDLAPKSPVTPKQGNSPKESGVTTNNGAANPAQMPGVVSVSKPRPTLKVVVTGSNNQNNVQPLGMCSPTE
jgi:hypothetical protein